MNDVKLSILVFVDLYFLRAGTLSLSVYPLSVHLCRFFLRKPPPTTSTLPKFHVEKFKFTYNFNVYFLRSNYLIPSIRFDRKFVCVALLSIFFSCVCVFACKCSLLSIETQ